MTEIISEIGVNWSGDLSIAEYMILMSKQAGADYVKFQMFNEEVIKNSIYKDELRSMILHKEELLRLYNFAKDTCIKFGVSTMYKEAFDVLDSAGIVPDFIKIRYMDRKNEDIALRAVEYCRSNDVTLIVSCEDCFIGARIQYDTTYIYNDFSFTNFMYCVPKYPPELHEINKSVIENEYYHGYSNHYPSKFLPMIAVMSKLKFIEVHVKRNIHPLVLGINKGNLSVNQLDENVSLSFDDLRDVRDFRDLLLNMR